MTRSEAERIAEAIRTLEQGLPSAALGQLRNLLDDAGQAVPAPLKFEARDKKAKERPAP